MRILLDTRVKYHVVTIDDNNFLILFYICEIAVFALAVSIIAYISGHYWSARFYRGALIGSYFKVKSSHGSDSESGEEADETKVGGFRQFGVNYLYPLVEHILEIVYGILCCMFSCNGFPF